MPLQTTAALSSRVTKPHYAKPPLLRAKKSASGRSRSRASDDEHHDPFESRLADIGPVRSFSGRLKERDVTQCLNHIAETMFDDIPERRSGMNPTRLVEVRNYRRRLPPLATVSHVHALSTSPTAAEREIAQLVARGVVRKLKIPGRGLGTTYIGEFIILTAHWVDLVERNEHLADDTKRKYISILRHNPSSTTVSNSAFTQEQSSELIRTGFLTTGTIFTRGLPGAFTAPDAAMRGSLSSLASAAARNATGTIDAVGGDNAIHDAGGRIAGQNGRATQMLNFSLPSVGVYLTLLSRAREHLVDLFARSKFKEIPSDLLRERWDGGIATRAGQSGARGLDAPIVPGRTRKWKHFHGLKYQWVLEECLGTGAIECFDTGSVGLGVRLPT